MTEHQPAVPEVHVLPGRDKRLRHGHPWLFSNELRMDEACRTLQPGSLVRLIASDNRPLGVATFNPHTLIAARRLSPACDTAIDESFFAARLRSALALRDRWYREPYYRVVHAEADGLPGLVIDRFGDVAVIQANTAGMDRHLPLVIAAVEDVLRPNVIVLRNDTAARRLEGLSEETRLVKGSLDGPVAMQQNGAAFFADPLAGQKTGWFFDQRENRNLVARLASGASVLDLYAYAGGFGVLCATAGAASVRSMDSSQTALALAQRAAEANGVGDRCRFERGDGFETITALAEQRTRFDIVVADPPAFIKSKKDVPAGARAYRKLVRLCARLTRPGGFLFVASCSHNLLPDRFAEEVANGLLDANREGRILSNLGAAPDHPQHPYLPESSYLKAQLLTID